MNDMMVREGPHICLCYILWRNNIFFLSFKVFCGASDTPVLDFWWHLLWVSQPEWAAFFMLGRGIHFTWSLRFTAGVTPADLLVASMAAKLISSMYLQAGIGGTIVSQVNTLPTELYCCNNWKNTPFLSNSMGMFFQLLHRLCRNNIIVK